eukprot:305698_1
MVLFLYNKSRLIHGFYELWIRGISSYEGYPRAKQLSFYKKHMSKSINHLEIGCASMYLPTNASNDRTNTNYYLFDIENTPLVAARKKMVSDGIPNKNIHTIRGNALEIDRTAMPNITFDTIGISLVLHCIPGSFKETLPLIINGLSNNMDENTILFGTTVCNPSLDPEFMDLNTFHHYFMLKYLQWLQKHKVLNNQNQKHSDLDEIFGQYFQEYNVDKNGYVSTFDAKSARLFVSC